MSVSCLCQRRRSNTRAVLIIVFFFKQKTAYEMRISDWSSDVCSSDLRDGGFVPPPDLHGQAIDALDGNNWGAKPPSLLSVPKGVPQRCASGLEIGDLVVRLEQASHAYGID